MSQDERNGKLIQKCRDLALCLHHFHKIPMDEVLPSSCCSLTSTDHSICICASTLEDIRLSIRSADDAPLQEMIWSTPECHKSLSCFHKWLYSVRDHPAPNSKSQLDVTASEPSKLDDSLVTHESCPAILDDTLAKEWAMCFGNLIMSNKDAVQTMDKHFGASLILDAVLHGSTEISQVWCTSLLCCLQVQSIAQQMHSEWQATVQRLCLLYGQESKFACFARYCIEKILCHCISKVGALECWKELNVSQRLLILTILGELAKDTKRNVRPTVPTLGFLTQVFMDEAGRILSNDEKKLVDCDPRIVREASVALVIIAGQDEHRPVMQKQENLLFVSLCFLKAVNEATFGPANSSWAKDHLTGTDTSVGLRCDLVQLIGSLVYRCKDNFEQLRNREFLKEVFFSCQRDDNNPLMQEAIKFALSCSYLDNLAQRELSLDGIDGSAYTSSVLETVGLQPKLLVQVPPTDHE